MRYFFLTIALCLGFVWGATQYASAQAEEDGRAAAAAELDAGVDAASSPSSPAYMSPEHLPDLEERPSEAFQIVQNLWKLGAWPAIAAALLIIARAIVKRLQPREGDKPKKKGWRAKVLAIAAAAVAVLGPLLELLMHTGGAAALVSGAVYAFGLLKHSTDPERGSARPEAA